MYIHGFYALRGGGGGGILSPTILRLGGWESEKFMSVFVNFVVSEKILYKK